MTTPHYPITLHAATIARFQQDGFVKTPNVLNIQELGRHARAVDAEVARRTATDNRPLSDKSTYEQSFIQCMRLWETSADVKALSCHAGLAGMAAQLLGVDSVRLWQDQALYKESGGRETTAHQDETFWPIGAAPLISAWIPFDAITIHNGAMAYVPGSHKAGPLKTVDITHRSEPYDHLANPQPRGQSPQWVDVDPGAVVWHDGFTVHQASANESPNTRRVFTVVYIASNAERLKTWPCFPLDRENIEVGDRLRGSGMPIVWPPSPEPPEPPGMVGETLGPQQNVQRS